MMILHPILSEKSYATSQQGGTYVFEVPGNATKQEVAAAVSEQFKVGVANVNILNRKGKTKRSLRKGRMPVSGQEKISRRAYVTLKSGDKIAVFEEV